VGEARRRSISGQPEVDHHGHRGRAGDLRGGRRPVQRLGGGHECGPVQPQQEVAVEGEDLDHRQSGGGGSGVGHDQVVLDVLQPVAPRNGQWRAGYRNADRRVLRFAVRAVRERGQTGSGRARRGDGRAACQHARGGEHGDDHGGQGPAPPARLAGTQSCTSCGCRLGRALAGHVLLPSR
jgi:hypothetical protein